MKCIICGKNAESEFCFHCKPKTPLRTSRKMSRTTNRTAEMRTFFLGIWSKRPHYSEVSGSYLGKEPRSTFFHHILPKEKYPDMQYDEENIILLSFEEHEQVENNSYIFEEVNYRRDYLKYKYNLSN